MEVRGADGGDSLRAPLRGGAFDLAFGIRSASWNSGEKKMLRHQGA